MLKGLAVIAEKGPLNNAFVFYDYNFNGIWDSNEPFTKTDEDGSFELNGRTGFSFHS